ncbi:MAG: DnaB-like helicase N-terminal domain-containing protein, partial [Aestuariivirga sp.]
MNARVEAPWTESVPSELAVLRVPPHSAEAEQSVLGGLLLENAAFDRIVDRIGEADFYRREHRCIFAAIAGLVAQSKPADVITVHERLTETEAPEQSFGLVYLNALAQSVPSAANIRRYAEIVRERSVLRRLIAVADNAATDAFNTKGRSVEEIVGRFSAELAGLERQQIRNVPQPLSDVVARQLDHYAELEAGNVLPGMPTGFAALDELLSGGLRAGLYIVAARPS